jgi:hypothetical protein
VGKRHPKVYFANSRFNVVLLPGASWSNLAFLNNAMTGFHIDFPLEKVD